MSGRKQHYIPQFLLRGFSEPGRGKKPQVRVIGRERSFIAPTDGVAAQREFYSELGEGDGSLDDLITEAETEYADIHRRLLSTPECVQPSSTEIARLLSHLTVRGGHIRDTVTQFGKFAVDRAVDLISDQDHMRARLGMDLSEPNSELRGHLDEAYNKNKSAASKAGMSRHEFRRKAFRELKTRWDEVFTNSIPEMRMLASLLNVSQLAMEGHKKSLIQSLEPTEAVRKLEDLEWVIHDWGCPTLVLPDCVAIGHSVEAGALPLFFAASDKFEGVLFPVSAYRAVCAGAYADEEVLRTLGSNFDVFAAGCSWNFVVAPPSFEIDQAISAGIGLSVAAFLSKIMEDAIAEILAEAITG